MDLFTYLMAKKGHNTHRDLFSYLLGKKESGTYTTFSGTSLNISNTLQAKIKNIALEGNTSQDGTPTPDTPIPIKVVTGEQSIEIKNSDSTLSQTYPLSLGNIELAKQIYYKDYIFKNEVSSPYYNDDLDLNEWYLHKENIIQNLWQMNWVYDSEYSTPVPRTVLQLTNMISRGNYLSNCFLSSEMNNQQIVNRLKTDNAKWYIALADSLTGIETTDSNSIKLNKIITYLQSVSAYICYGLATPTNTKITDTTLIQQLENINNNARSYSDTTIIICSSESTDNEAIGFSGKIKVTSVNLGNLLNTSLLSSNLQEELNLDEIENVEQNDEPIENEEIEEPIEEYQEL